MLGRGFDEMGERKGRVLLLFFVKSMIFAYEVCD